MAESKVGLVHGNVYAGPGDHVRDAVEALREATGGHHHISVLNVAEDYVEFPHHRDVLYVHAGLNDAPADKPPPWGEANSAEAYVNGVMMLDRLVDLSDRVYVHCHEGVSRTGIVLSLYFAWVYDLNPEDAGVRIGAVYPRIKVHPKHWEVAPEVMAKLSVQRPICLYYWRSEGVIGG